MDWRILLMNNQIPSTNHQIMTEISMTEIPNISNNDSVILDIRTLGNWDLFGVWNLGIGT
jgi:hypothetical protein